MTNKGYFVIDAHCHVYPEKIAARAVSGIERFYDLTAHGDGLVTTLLTRERNDGIDRFVIQSVATAPRQVRTINDFIAATVAEHPDVLTGLGTLHPASEDMRGDLEHLASLGLHGVKLHPDIQAFPIDDPRMMPAYAFLEEHGLPVLFHTGDDRYDFSNPNRLKPVLHAFPRLTVVGAHLGGYSIWNEAAAALADEPNLFVDASSSLSFLDDAHMVSAIRQYGTERVLFGTDFPLFSAATELGRFLSLGFDEREYRAMLAGNAARVYGVPLPEDF